MRRDNLKAVGHIEGDCHGDKSPRNDGRSEFVREIATASTMPRNDSGSEFVREIATATSRLAMTIPHR